MEYLLIEFRLQTYSTGLQSRISHEFRSRLHRYSHRLGDWDRTQAPSLVSRK